MKGDTTALMGSLVGKTGHRCWKERIGITKKSLVPRLISMCISVSSDQVLDLDDLKIKENTVSSRQFFHIAQVLIMTPQ